METCSVCGVSVERRKLGPHISAHVRSDRARYKYKPGNKHPFELKTCPTCGTTTWLSTRVTFCSLRCSRLGENNPAWKGNDAKPTAARLRAHSVITTMVACKQCGKTGRLHRHHIDGDTFNNDPANLIVLCEPCHKNAHRKPRRNCAVCGQPCKRARSVYCSRVCCGLASRGQKRGGRVAA